MAEQADGSIVVAVDMDAEGFKAGSARLQGAVKSFVAQSGKLGAAFQKAMDGNISSIAAFNGKAQLLESTMASVRKEMLASADTMAPTEVSEALASAAKKAEQEQAALQKSIAATEEKLEKAKINAQGYYDEVAQVKAGTNDMLKVIDNIENPLERIKQEKQALELEEHQLKEIEKKYASRTSKVKELTASLEKQKERLAELPALAEEFRAQAEKAMKPFSETESYRQISQELEKAAAKLTEDKEQIKVREDAFKQADMVKSLGLDKAESAIARLQSQLERLQFKGASPDSAPWKDLQFNILQAEKQLEEYGRRAEALHSAGSLGGEAYQKISGQIAQARAQLQGMSAQIEKQQAAHAQVTQELARQKVQQQEQARQAEKTNAATQQSAASMGKLSQKSKEASGRVNQTAAAGGRLTSHLRKALGYLGRMVSGMARMAFHSRDTSRGVQGLLSSLKRLTPALLAAEGVMGLLRKAVSAYMQENQQMANTLGACWSSIGNMLGPIIERLVNLVALASAYFTRFLQLLGFVGKSTSKAISTAGGAAAGASKELKRQLASFDELNILQDSGAGGSGGGGGIGDLTPELPEVELPDWAKLMAEQIKKGDWGGAGKTLGEAFNRFIHDFDWEGWGSRLGGAVQKGIDFGLNFMRTANWVGLGAGGATFLNNFLASINPHDLGALLASKIDAAIKLAYGFVTTFQWPEFGIWLAGVVTGWFGEIDWGMAGKTLSQAIIGLLDTARNFFETADWKDIGAKVGEFFKNIDWGGIWSGLWDAAVAAGGALMDFLDGLHDGLGGLLPIVGAIGAAFAAWKIGSGITDALDKVFGLFGKKGGANSGGGFQIHSPKTVLKGLVDLTLIIGGVIALVEALGALNQIPGFAETAQSGLDALKQVFSGIAQVALPLAGVGVAVVALGKVGVSNVVQGLGGLASIVLGIPAVITALGALMSVPGFGEFLSTGVRSLQDCFSGLMEVAAPIGVMSAIIIGLGFATPSVILSGLGGFALIIGGLEAVLVALGALNQLPGFSWIVGEGGKALMQLGEILGGFAGSIVSGLITTVSDSFPQVADNLSQFAEKLEPFLSAMGHVDSGVSQSAQTLADAVLAISGASLLDAVASWITGDNAMVKFGQQLAEFAPYFHSYYQQIKNIAPDVVTASASAAQALAAFANNIPGTGGVLQWFLGEKDMELFGQQLVIFGQSFKKYYNSVKDVDPVIVDASAAAAKSLAALANDVPSTGGILQWFLGEKDLEAFGNQLVAFGRGFASYAVSVSGIDANVVDASAAAAQSLTELAQNVPTTGGILSWFTGNNSIDAFGASLAAFGKYFKQYYDHISGISAKAITDATEAIGGLLSMAKQAQGVDAKGLTDFGQAIADFGKKLSGAAWLTVSGDFSAGVADMASAAGESAANMGRSMDEITQGWQDTRKATGKETDSIKRDTTTKWNAIKSTMGTAFASIKQNANTSTSQVKTSVQNAWGQASSNTTTKWNSIKNTVSTNTNGMKSAVSSGFRAISSSISSHMSSALRSISGQNWYNIGAGICTGIYNGLAANWSWLQNTVSNLAYSLYYTARRTLGIHSPSRLFKKGVGLNIGYGVGEGIEDSKPAIMESVSGVANSIAAGFKAQEYAVQPISVDKASGLPRALDGFSDTVADSFANLLDRLEAIAQRVTFTMPAVAGTVAPYKVSSPHAGEDSKAAETIEASNEELGSVVIQVVSQAAAAIVRAIEENSGGSGTPLDRAGLLQAVKEDLSKETKMRGKSPLLV